MHIFLDFFRRNAEESNSVDINEVDKLTWRGLCGHCPYTSFALERALDSKPSIFKRLVVLVFCFFDYTGRNFGQVFFCNNPFTGLIIFTGLLWISSQLALYGLAASTYSMIFAVILGESRTRISSGLSSFNSVLVGVVLAKYLQLPNTHVIMFWILLALLTGFSVLLSNSLGFALGLGFMALPALTLPFNVLAVLTHFLRDAYSLIGANNMSYSSTIVETSLGTDFDFFEVLRGCLLSTGQVFAIQDFYFSTFILISLVPFSPIMTCFAVFGSLIGTFLGAVINPVFYALACKGILGYNSLLSSCALWILYVPSWRSILLAFTAAVLSTMVHISSIRALGYVHADVYTIPFVIGTLLVIGTSTNKIMHPLDANHWLSNKRSAPDLSSALHTSISTECVNSTVLFTPSQNPTSSSLSIQGSSSFSSSHPSYRSSEIPHTSDTVRHTADTLYASSYMRRCED